ncbi:MAG TPA: zinc-binding dehydrogenase [Trebonia sp.]|jgi:inner membrane transporter RhtA|nr:zinc-binding dehydrogenase [Trebonia sp.]
MPRSTRLTGIALMTTSAASNQFGAATAALAFPVLGPAGVVAVRQWVAGALLLATARPKLSSLTREQRRPVLGLALIFATMNLSLYAAIDTIGLGLAVTLEFLGPLSVALLASRRVIDVGCGVVAAVAVVVLARPQPSTDYAGIALALLAAACWAGYILVNRVVGARVPGSQGPAAAACLSALLYVPVGIWALASQPVTLTALGRAATAGVLCSAVPMVADMRALRRVPARFFGLFMSVNPVFAALTGLLILRQSLRPADWLAIAAIVTANAVTVTAGNRAPRVRSHPFGRARRTSDGLVTRKERDMRAVRIHEPTGISGLVCEDAPDATPMIGDVLVKVAACGITHTELDWPIWTCSSGHQRASIVPGHEFSGVVTALGWGTAGLAVGDEVFGLIDAYRDGAAAEYIAIEARDVAPKPKTVDHIHAAAVPRAGLTAWQALFDHGRLSKGQTVVIHGAGGAVGSTAVQLAHWAGAEVIGTGRSRSRSLATELGADRYLALDEEGLDEAAGQADLVFDTIGGDVLAGSAALLKPGGTLVSVAAAPPADREDITTLYFVQHPSREQLTELARLVDTGHLRPQVGGVYPLADAAQAYSAKAAGGIPGRIILQP